MNTAVNHKAPSYFIASSCQRCAHCENSTVVVALVLPPGHETLEVDADTPAGEHTDDWIATEAGAILFDVEYLPAAVLERVRKHSHHFHAEIDERTGYSTWVNHCTFCAAPQADFELYCEPEGAFMPTSPAAAEKIRLHQVCEPFEAQVAGYACAPQFLEYAQFLRED